MRQCRPLVLVSEVYHQNKKRRADRRTVLDAWREGSSEFGRAGGPGAVVALDPRMSTQFARIPPEVKESNVTREV